MRIGNNVYKKNLLTLLDERIATVNGISVTTGQVANADDGYMQFLLVLIVTETETETAQMVGRIGARVLIIWYHGTLVQIRVEGP